MAPAMADNRGTGAEIEFVINVQIYEVCAVMVSYLFVVMKCRPLLFVVFHCISLSQTVFHYL